MWSELTGAKILPSHDYHNEGKQWCGLLPGLVLFGWWSLLFSQEWWDISGMGCMVPQLFTAGGNRLYPEFLAITSDLRYPGF
jgi:hypothetical protein